MKNCIFAIAISILAFSGTAFGVDLPVDEIWSQNLSASSRFLGDPWLSVNGNVSCFLANSDGLVLIDDGEVVWEGALPEGQLASEPALISGSMGHTFWSLLCWIQSGRFWNTPARNSVG